MRRYPVNLLSFIRYGGALLTVVGAVALRQALSPILGRLAAPFAFITVAIMFSAWLAGTGPAVVAMIFGLAAVDRYFLAPTAAAQGSANVIHIVTYLLVSGAAILMSAAYRSSSARYSEELGHREAISRELLAEHDALREAEEKFRAVAEIGSSAIFIHDGSKLLYVNRAGEELFGYSREELLGVALWQLAHPDYRGLLEARSAARLRGEQVPSRYEFKALTKSGEERWVDIGARLISFERKPCIIVNAFDVTDRRRADEVLKNREEHYRAAIEAGKVGTWEWDLRMNRITFSDNWYSLTASLDRTYEFKSHSQSGPYMDFAVWRESVYEEDRPKVDAAIQSAVELDAKYEVEFRVRQKGGNELRWLVALGRVQRDSDGNPLRMIGAAVDITERRCAEEALRKSEKLAAAGRLAASIAHEINNPLEAVTNLLFLARTTGVANSNGETLLKVAEEELRRAAHLTKRTLGFYRDSTSASQFKFADVIDDVLLVYARRMEAGNVKLQKEYFDVGEMYGMEGEFRQAISNLVANSLDAMSSRSGGTLFVRLRRTRHSRNGSALRVTIADSGIGIPHRLQRRIFEPFFTTKPETGTGLGLWLTQGIVEKHNGSIGITSSDTGKTGTVFVLTVPVGNVASFSASSAA